MSADGPGGYLCCWSVAIGAASASRPIKRTDRDDDLREMSVFRSAAGECAAIPTSGRRRYDPRRAPDPDAGDWPD